MDRRTHESPMDFEWQNPGGPADPTSPFYKLAQSSRRTGFNTPSKPLTSTTTPTFFSATSAKTAPQFRNPSFTTPRKPFDADLFSETSGAESSPADNADAEDTPEITEKKVNIISTKVKQPIFGKYGLGWGHSPGRSEVRRLGRYTESAVQKARKRKRMDRDHYSLTRRASTDSDEESGGSRPGSREKEKPQQREGWLGNFFTNLEKRRDLPYVLSHYPQILLNYFLFGCVVWLIVNFLSVVSGDLRHAQQEEQAVVLAEIAKCNQDYIENRCAPDTRLPALQSVCHAWEICMDRNPAAVSKSRLTAQAMGEALNSFIEPISWKAMVFMALLFGIGLAVSHALSGTANAVKQAAPPPPQQQWFPTPYPNHEAPQWGQWAPQTPSRHISNGYDDHQFAQIMPSQTPRARSQSPRKTSRN